MGPMLSCRGTTSEVGASHMADTNNDLSTKDERKTVNPSTSMISFSFLDSRSSIIQTSRELRRQNSSPSRGLLK